MSEESNQTESDIESRKRKLDSPDTSDTQKKLCTGSCQTKTDHQIIVMDYKSTISPKSEKFNGTVTLRFPVGKVGNGWIAGNVVSIGGFQWRIYARIVDNYLDPQIQCNDLIKSSLFVCKASCELGILTKDKKVLYSSVKSLNFEAAKLFLPFTIVPQWSSIVNEAQLVDDGHIIIQATVNIVNDAGFRTCIPNDFYSPSEYSDVVLKVGDKRFHVSKSTLAMHSPFFHSLFYSGFAERNKEEIELSDIDSKEFEVFLNVIYPSSYVVTVQNYQYLLKLADMFQVNSVLKACEDFLCMDVRCGKLETLQLADKYKLPRVLTACAATLKDAASGLAFTKATGFNDLSPVTKLEIFQRLSTFL